MGTTRSEREAAAVERLKVLLREVAALREEVRGMKGKLYRISNQPFKLDMKNKDEFRRYTKPAEMAKAINTLGGIIEGILLDGEVNAQETEELRQWALEHEYLVRKEPFREILELINGALADGTITVEELEDVKWVCNKFKLEGSYYDSVTASIQQLQGLCHGILADGHVNEAEMAGLRNWMSDHNFLARLYPFDEIHSILNYIMESGNAGDDELLMLKALFLQYSNIRVETIRASLAEEVGHTYQIRGFCAVSPEVVFEGKRFCFTGESGRATRAELQAFIREMGGIPQNNVTKDLDFLIVGDAGSAAWAFSCYGRKVEKALEYRQAGCALVVVQEGDFWGAAGGQ